ncbi:MAG: response regulator [Candidatus Riflebacteria bacterium]|nr:response regulator [Candidatus Riflebacteria bacterium]
MSVRVLLADDEEEYATSLARVLTRRGMVVKTVAGGQQAVAAMDQADFDVILLDLRMPGMDGLATLAEIRRRGATLPVILHSGMADLPSVMSALEEGITNFMAKPCSIEALCNAIEEAHECCLLASGAKAKGDPRP